MSLIRSTAALALLAVCLLAPPAVAVEVKAIDGDTILIGETRVRLDGIDAPELEQTCREASGAVWACGAAARDALNEFLGRGRPVHCDITNQDRYRRPVAICFSGQDDIGAWMVERGLALAYRRYATRYVPAEDRARAAVRGVWRTVFDPPWVWRRR